MNNYRWVYLGLRMVRGSYKECYRQVYFGHVC